MEMKSAPALLEDAAAAAPDRVWFEEAGADTGCNAAYLGDMLSYIITNSRAAVMIVSERYAGRLAGIDTGGLKTVVVPTPSTRSSRPSTCRTGSAST
jgi:hypothetical protein